MASITKRGSKYKVEVYKFGKRKSATFKAKSEANAWAVDTERKLEAQAKSNYDDVLFSDVIIRYQNEVTVNKKGRRSEILRLNRLLKYPIANCYLSDLQLSDFESYRDDRLNYVSSASVLRELTTISNIMTYAVDKWRYLPRNPMKGLSKPKGSKERSQRYSNEDIQAILNIAGYNYEGVLETQMQRVGCAMLFAIETAMRAGEITSLTWDKM